MIMAQQVQKDANNFDDFAKLKFTSRVSFKYPKNPKQQIVNYINIIEAKINATKFNFNIYFIF